MKRFIQIVICFVFLAGGIGAGMHFAATPEKAGKRGAQERGGGRGGGASGASRALSAPGSSVAEGEEKRDVRVLEAAKPESGSFSFSLKALGRVSPAVTAALRAQVSGRVVSVSPRWYPGGRVKKGETLLSVDPRDYEIALKRARAAVKSARAALELERARAGAAREEQRVLHEAGEDVTRAGAALRGPQLAAAEAALESARAGEEAAALDVARVRVSAPFDALILSRSADIGSVISAQDVLAQLAGDERYFIEVSVPARDLSRLTGAGTSPLRAKLVLQDGAPAGEAVFTAFSGRADPGSRMTGVLFAAERPAAKGLLAGDMVSAEITGRQAPPGTLRLPVGALQSGGRLYVITKEGKLAFRKAEIAFADDRYVYVTGGIAPDEEAATGEIPDAAEGMAARSVASGGEKR